MTTRRHLEGKAALTVDFMNLCANVAALATDLARAGKLCRKV